MGVGVASLPDPFAMNEVAQPLTAPIWKRTNNKAVRSNVLNTGVRELLIMTIGQSQMSNVNPTPYVPTNTSKVKNFNVLDGACYSVTGSLLGCTNYTPDTERGNPAARIADTLIANNVCDSVWLITPAVGNTRASQWDTGNVSDRIGISVARLASIGIPASRIDAILWGQGESDGTIGVTQAQYQSYLTSIISKSRALGVTAPWFIAKETYNGGVSAIIQAAQAALVNHGLGIWAGPDADAIGVGDRHDGLHFSDTGAATFASGWVSALASYGAPFV